MKNENSLTQGTILYGGETPYRIVDILGLGGFGITYLAIGEVKIGNVPIEAKFAIKEHFPTAYCTRAEDGTVEVRPDMVADFEASRTDFISEARKLHRLGAQNDNIVKVNEVFEANGTAYYVMQYINGESLQNYVRKNGPMPYNEAIKLLSPIIDAVEFLHKERINHLDIKPDNIMLHESVDGVTSILVDFGLCMHFTKKGRLTSTKGVQGVSEGYSPLEQYVGVNEFQPATDIYALIATLFYTLTGETPKNAAEIKLTDVRSRLAKVVPPQAVEGICKAMAKSIDDRTPSIAVLKADLGLITPDKGNVTTVLDRAPSDPSENSRRGINWALWGPVVLIIFSCTFLLFILFGTENKESKKETATSEVTSSTSPDTALEIKENDDSQQSQNSRPQKETETGTSATNSARTDNQGSEQERPERVQPTTGTLNYNYGYWTGGIKNGKPYGSGTLTFTSEHSVDRASSQQAGPGDYFVATYDDQGLVSGKLYDSEGTLIKTIIP